MSQVLVWDRFVRLFHWSLVALFLVSYLSGDELQSLHTWSGYGIAVLVAARVLWGLVGSRYARFGEFVYRPSVVLGYLKDIFNGSPKRYLGHNPAGGMMVIALLVALSTTTISGMKLLAVEEGEGPFADATVSLFPVAQADRDDDEWEEGYDREDEAEEFWEELHEFSVNLLLLLILLHVIGVFVASVQHDESLVKAMFTGRKDDH